MKGREARISALERVLQERIVIVDGAMGTMIQSLELPEAAFRGERFAQHAQDLRGNNDLLCLTQPDAVREDPRRLPGGRCGHHRNQHL